MVPPWDVGDPIGTGDDIGAPEVPYMSYGPRRVESEEESEEESIKRKLEEERKERIAKLNLTATRISDEAWELYTEDRSEEALVFINRALEYCDWNASIFNTKAIILEDLKRYDDALDYYDKAIELDSSKNVFQFNKAKCLTGYAEHLNELGDANWAIEKVNDALEIFQNTQSDESEREDEAWNVKGMILEKFEDIPGAFNSYKKALEIASSDSKMKETYRQNRDRVLALIDDSDVTCPECGNTVKVTDNFCLKCGARVEFAKTSLKKNKEFIRNIQMKDNISALIIPFDEEGFAWADQDLIDIGRSNLVTVAGCVFYGFEDRLVEGVRLRLVKEPDNIYDSDAIAVYSGGDKVGYVSNSDNTNSPFSSMASELKWFADEINAEYLCKYEDVYHIARIIR